MNRSFLTLLFTAVFAAKAFSSAEWQAASTAVSGDFTHVAFGDGVFAALAADVDGDSRLVRSDTPGEWSEVTLPDGVTLSQLAFGKDEFLAIGQSGEENAAFVSDSGEVWTEVEGVPEIDEAFESFFYGGGYYWLKPEGSDIYRSDDLLGWSLHGLPSGRVLWHGEWLLLVATGSPMPATAVWDSEEGALVSGLFGTLTGSQVDWASGADRAVALVADGNRNAPAVSADGSFWVTYEPATSGWRGIAAIEDGFLALGEGTVFSSKDGARWADRSAGAENHTLLAAADGDGRIVAIGEEGSILERPAGFAPKIINASSGDKEVAEGEPLRLAVEATGSGALSIQWMKDGQPVSGGDNPLLAIDAASSGNAGSYHAVVSNDVGSVEAEPMEVVVSGSGASPHAWRQIASLPGHFRAVAAGQESLVAIGSSEPWDEGQNTESFFVGASDSGVFWLTGRGSFSDIMNAGQVNISYRNGEYMVATGEVAAVSNDRIAWRTVKGGLSERVSLVGVHDGLWFAGGSNGFFTSYDGDEWEEVSVPSWLSSPSSAFSDGDRLLVAAPNGAFSWSDGEWRPLVSLSGWSTDHRIARAGGVTLVLGEDYWYSDTEKQGAWSRAFSEVAGELRDVITFEDQFVAGGPDGVSSSADGTWWGNRSEGLDGAVINALAQSEEFFYAAGDDGVIFTRPRVLEPVFHVWPRDAERVEGEPLRFQARATGAGEISYQWYRDGEEIDGADGPLLEIPAVGPVEAGVYTVSADGAHGETVSPPATVTLLDEPPESVEERNEVLSQFNGYPPMLLTDGLLMVPWHGNGRLHVSYDGREWLRILPPDNDYHVRKVGEYFVSRGDGNVSEDGLFWRDKPEGAPDLRYAAYEGGTYVTRDGLTFYYSDDFENWAAADGDSASGIYTILHTGEKFVGLGSGVAAFSDDGTSWTRHETDLDGTLGSVAYGHGLFVAVVGRAPYRSVDGLSWERVPYVTVGEFVEFAGGNFWSGSWASKDGLRWFDRALSDWATQGIGRYDEFDFIFINRWGKVIRRSPILEPVFRSEDPAVAHRYPGDSASFWVEVHGSEPMVGRWLKDGEPVSESGDLENITTGVAGSPEAPFPVVMLDLENIGAADEGVYTLEAENRIGTAESRAFHLRYLGDFDTWADYYGGWQDVLDPEDDPGGFGVPNVLRYAFRLDPTNPDREGLPQTSVAAENGERYLALAFTLMPDDGFSWVVEVSGDLVEWEPVENPVWLGDRIVDGVRKVELRDSTPLGETEARFLRVRVVLEE